MRVATWDGASGMASDPITPRVAACCIRAPSAKQLGNRATCLRSYARPALVSDLCRLRGDRGDTLLRTTGALPTLLVECFVRAMDLELGGGSWRGSGRRRSVGKTKRKGRRFGDFSAKKECSGYSAS